MSGYVTELEVGEVVAAAPHLKGAWQDFTRSAVHGPKRVVIDAVGVERLVYGIAGTGTAVIGGATVPVTAGSSFVLGLGSDLFIDVGDEELELFIVTLKVPSPSGSDYA
jgi:hypothetical protein